MGAGRQPRGLGTVGMKAEENRSAKGAEWHLRLAEAQRGSFDSGPSACENPYGVVVVGYAYDVVGYAYGVVGYAPGATSPVSGSTCVAGGRGAMLAVRCPTAGPPWASWARARPESPAATT